MKEELGEFDPADLVVYMSPFSRTVETAGRAAGRLGLSLMDPRLKV